MSDVHVFDKPKSMWNKLTGWFVGKRTYIAMGVWLLWQVKAQEVFPNLSPDAFKIISDFLLTLAGFAMAAKGNRILRKLNK